MVNRRSMGAALEVTTEQAAFIQGGAIPPVKPQTATIPKVETVATETEPLERSARQERQDEQPIRRSRGRRQTRAPLPRGDEPLLGIANLLMPLTTRLQPTTFAALKRAGLERKLHGQTPSTVQEIAEEAIQDWLRDSGYLS